MTENLSIIIPTLNAAAILPGTLAALGTTPEIIVVDGGSTDDTVAIAAASGVCVLSAARGRGTQLPACRRIGAQPRNLQPPKPATSVSALTAKTPAPDGSSGWSPGAIARSACPMETRAC
jgi:cellulose synthase/poly-beta-1,6-N-acetylglucosamine synthase-like glycosyltransferase